MPQKGAAQKDERASEEVVPDGVFIGVVQGEEGIDLQIQTLGNTKVTEVLTVLEIAYEKARDSLGLPKR